MDNNNEIMEQNNFENVVEPQNQIPVYEEPKKDNTGKIVFGIIIGILIIALGAVLAVSALKSDEQKFYELLFEKQSINSLVQDIGKNGEISAKVEVDLNKIAKSKDEELEADIKVGIDTTSVVKGKNTSFDLNFQLNDKNLLGLEYAVSDDLFGVRVKDTNEDFIAFRNENLKEVLEKFDLDTSDIPDKFLTKDDFEKVIKTKPSDLKAMRKKYIKVLAKNSEVEVSKNEEIKFGDREIKATKYTLKLTEKDAFNIAKGMLETIKDDEKNVERLLDDCKAILDLMEENNYPMNGVYSDFIPDVGEVMEAIEELYDTMIENVNIEELDDKNVIIEISVYEHKGETVATELVSETGDITIIIKTLLDKDLYIALEAEINGEIGVFALEDKIKNQNDINAECFVKYEKMKVPLFTIETKNSSKTSNLIKLNKKNALILNDADEEELEEYEEEFMEKVEKITKKLNKEVKKVSEDFDDEILSDMGINDIVYLLFPFAGVQVDNSAQFSTFAQEFGDYQLNFRSTAVGTLKEKYAVKGVSLTDAQYYQMAADNTKTPEQLTGQIVPPGVHFKGIGGKGNIYSLSGTDVCYLITDDSVAYPGYKINEKFYGDSLGTEKHYVSQRGSVFTIPGYPRTVDDEMRMYITPSEYYIVNINKGDSIAELTEATPAEGIVYDR